MEIEAAIVASARESPMASIDYDGGRSLVNSGNRGRATALGLDGARRPGAAALGA